MNTVLAVSPHLDDAVFSAGATLARFAASGWRVVVATCFTASVARPQGFALACQLDKGLGPEVDYMALRRAEDEAACHLIGAEAVHLPFAEAPHRGYDDAPALFGPRRTDDHDVESRLKAELAGLVRRFNAALIMGPACIGDHVDHHVVRNALTRVASGTVLLWADLPYAARAAVLPQGADPVPCGDELDRKLAAAAAYASQIGFQFGSEREMRDRLSIAGAEHFWSAGPGSGAEPAPMRTVSRPWPCPPSSPLSCSPPSTSFRPG